MNCSLRHRLVMLIAAMLMCFSGLAAVGEEGPTSAAKLYAEIRVVDSETGRGVPLVELETVSGTLFVTDNAGRVAFFEPGLMDHEIYFHVRSHGYHIDKDRFGFAGARVTPRAGQLTTIKIKRDNAAERLCRLTGEGLYRDSVMLGHDVSLEPPLNRGDVAGQDTVQTAIYRDRVYWFWGDTNRMSYPLGLFRMAGATTPVPTADNRSFDPAVGIPFEYFIDNMGFARAMMPLPERPEGVIWIESVFVVPDETGRDRLVGHYSRREGLGRELEQGIAVFNDDKQIFESIKPLPLEEKWRRPKWHPAVYDEGDDKWLIFGSPSPNVRVRATLADVLDPSSYEAFTCLESESQGLERPKLDDAARPVWRWQKDLPPVDSRLEAGWVRDGVISAEAARYLPRNGDEPHESIELHRGSVRWNKYRQRWILIACQIGGGPSHLGEIWYAESKQPTGPFRKAVRIVTHDRQTFYNPCHHQFLDTDGGRTIHFEGTYCNTFSGNEYRTPRYNYNQVLYRLDLDAPQLRAARVEEKSTPLFQSKE